MVNRRGREEASAGVRRVTKINFRVLRVARCNRPCLCIPQSHKYTKRMTDYDPRSTNPLSGSTSYIYKMI